MFSSTKKVSDEQLIDDLVKLLGKYVPSHSQKAEEVLGGSAESLFLFYTWLYTYLSTQAMAHNLGVSTRTLALEGKLEDYLIEYASSSAPKNDEKDKLIVAHKKEYEGIAQNLGDAFMKEAYTAAYIEPVAKAAVVELTRLYTTKPLQEFADEIGGAEFKRFLIVVNQCYEFNAAANKLLSKRVLS